MGSIWLAWWLAKRDIAKRIKGAQEETISRLGSALLQSDVTETLRALQQAREASRAKRWERAIDRCEQAQHRIPRFASLPGLEEGDRAKLELAVDQLRLLTQQLEEVIAGKRTDLTRAKSKDLDELITTLAVLEGKLRASGLR